MLRPARLLQQTVPPLGLTYFFVCWRICTLKFGAGYISTVSGNRQIGYAYSAFATLSISLITLVYLRLYFLPRNQSTPPFNPPIPIRAKEVIFECLSPPEAAALRLAHPELKSSAASDVLDSPSEDPAIGASESTPLLSNPNERSNSTKEPADQNEPLVNRCYRGTCQGRWKPPRARHCSLCGTCRAGFDHHCAIFANCLTAPHIPTFLCLVTITPPTVLALVSPLLFPLLRRTRAAWEIACQSDDIRRRWWDWKPSWIVAGGPMGRWVGGLILGWKVLDAADGGGVDGAVRLQIGVLVFLGLIFSAICIALAFATTSVIRSGHLTVDRERLRSHHRARQTILSLQRRSPSAPIPQTLIDQIERYSDRRWFFVPVPSHRNGGVILATLPEERAYDLGPERNWEIIMGKGWSWIVPWIALQRGMGMEEVCQWPIDPEVELRLREEAARLVGETASGH